MLALNSVTALVLSGLSTVGGQSTRTGSMSMCVREGRLYNWSNKRFWSALN